MLHDGSGDLITLLLSLLLGIVLCLIYDGFKIVRIAVACSTTNIFFQDIIYFIIAAFSTFILLLIRTFGEVRWFVLAGQILGFILCRWSLSRLILSVSQSIINGVKAIFSFINKFLVNPLKKILQFIMLKIKNISIKLQKKAVKIFKFILKSIYGLLYNRRNGKRQKPKVKKVKS